MQYLRTLGTDEHYRRGLHKSDTYENECNHYTLKPLHRDTSRSPGTIHLYGTDEARPFEGTWFKHDGYSTNMSFKRQLANRPSVVKKIKVDLCDSVIDFQRVSERKPR